MVYLRLNNNLFINLVIESIGKTFFQYLLVSIRILLHMYCFSLYVSKAFDYFVHFGGKKPQPNKNLVFRSLSYFLDCDRQNLTWIITPHSSELQRRWYREHANCRFYYELLENMGATAKIKKMKCCMVFRSEFQEQRNSVI